jgi:exodeoxyribonuclease III
MPDILTIATYNANSIRVRLDQMLDWLQRVRPDALCVQETRCSDEDFPVEPIREAGWRVAYRGRGGRAGVAIIAGDDLEDVAYGLDDEEDSDEHRLIRARLRGIQVINTYVPQGKAIEEPEFHYKLRWFERLCAFLDRHYRPAEPLLWVGDLNVAPEPIDVYDPKRLAEHVDFHPEVRKALERVKAWGFEDVFRRLHPGEPEQYTYWDYRARNPVPNKVGWRVDHIMATPPLAAAATEAWIDVEARLAQRPSDHTFLVGRFDLSRLG